MDNLKLSGKTTETSLIFQASESLDSKIRSSLVFSLAEKKLKRGNSEDKIKTLGRKFLDKRQTATQCETGTETVFTSKQ